MPRVRPGRKVKVPVTRTVTWTGTLPAWQVRRLAEQLGSSDFPNGWSVAGRVVTVPSPMAARNDYELLTNPHGSPPAYDDGPFEVVAASSAPPGPNPGDC